MLKPELAREELKKLVKSDWVAARVAASEGLTGVMRDTARSIFGADKKPEADRRDEKIWRWELLVKTFKEMDVAARRHFFETCLPGLGGALESAWQLQAGSPYQTGFNRKPFRAPNHPETLTNRRIHWFMNVLRLIGPYQPTITWLAAWAPHIGQYGRGDTLGILLAGAIEAGGAEGEEVFQIICASGRNEHEIGGMGRHVTRALLCASRLDGWEFVEKMLLAAQREEGLRQVILETVDEAHPQAFRRMLKLILEHNLTRFSATVRAFDTWLGYQWEGASAGVVNQTIEKISLYLEDSAARAAALQEKDAEQVYLALWTHAFDDAVATVKPATELLQHPKPEPRYVAAHLLAQLGLLASQKNLLPVLDDADLRVATRAFQALHHGADLRVKKGDLFERLEKLVERYPAKAEKLKPAVWPWTAVTISKEMAADKLPENLGERPPTRLIAQLPNMGPNGRMATLGILTGQGTWDAATRDTLFALVGDASRSVREAALRHLGKCQITPVEAAPMEALLDRKAGDLRRGALTLLARQSDGDALASADRLLAAKSQPQRQAGLELLRDLHEKKRCVEEVRRRAEAYAGAHPTLNEAERQQVENILATGTMVVPKLDDALGLLRHEDRTWVPALVAREVVFHTPVAGRILLAVESLLSTHAQTVVEFKKSDGDPWSGLFSDLQYAFPDPDPKLPYAEDREHLPLAGVWENWWQTRGPELRDADGMELLRALARCNFIQQNDSRSRFMQQAMPDSVKTVIGEIVSDQKIQQGWRISRVLQWLLRWDPPAGAVAFALDLAERALALVPASVWRRTAVEAEELKELRAKLRVPGQKDWQGIQARMTAINAPYLWREDHSPNCLWLQVAQRLAHLVPQLWSPELHVRHWRCMRWLDEPLRPLESGGDSGLRKSFCLPRERPKLAVLCQAHAAGGATEADILEALLGDHEPSGYFARQDFHELRNASGRKLSPDVSTFAFLPPLVDRCRKRILEVELTRGDQPTAASAPALSLRHLEGTTNLIGILRTLSKRNFVRGWLRDNESLETVMSHLTRSCFPAAGETAEDFGRLTKEAKISEDRLVELAVYAPQWAQFVETALGWPALTEAVWWIHAHTKGDDWSVDKEIRELWEADMNSRTSLSAADLVEGGVDVQWFHRIYQALGVKRWNALYEAAKLASTGGGHARARLFADAMLGDISKRELVQRITKKRHQDSVRALGLLPLAAGEKREADLLGRYQVIQEFRRGSKEFGSQRQASEKRAAQIGQQNLARTAGFADPIRLEWAMEARAVEDLADGPIAVTVEDVTVSLGIDAWGEIEFSVARAGKTISDIPAKLKKDPKIAALRERKVQLKRQASRIRPSLEQFMVRGDEFTVVELRDLMKHPLLAPMLKNLVIIGEGILGYPVHDGQALENHAGTVEAIKAGEKLRIAHPHDLLPAAEWHRWQKDCFARERIQPFKQVFREYYPLAGAEKENADITRRYAGHQVQPRQALALLGQRGWVFHPEEGVRKTFHDSGLVAWLTFEEAFNTPAEVEGLTLEGVVFTRRDDHKHLKLEQLPPRLFSETMRDMDLVVSVAHRGGVDPEASASTVEMRATLVAETARLLKLANVQLKDRYALIQGQLGEYSIHLGSAVTRKLPGEMLFLIPVHSQHRGRLFLPFADDDPRSAEVLSKVLLLARDHEIKDPNILDQLR